MPVIRLHAYDPHIITWQEFEQLEKEIMARIMAGDATLGDAILARMLDHNRFRYVECKNAAQVLDSTDR